MISIFARFLGLLGPNLCWTAEMLLGFLMAYLHEPETKPAWKTRTWASPGTPELKVEVQGISM